MTWKGWDHVPLDIPGSGCGEGRITVDAITPLIISATRSTDIPAFYGTWFIERLGTGYVKWKNPFGGRPVYVSFARTRLFVFWSKNPAPFLPMLDTIDRFGFSYYFLYTLNDYDAERLEPGVPPIEERIGTFIRLSRRIGKGRVVWRFDPLILSDRISVRDLLEKIRRIGEQISPFCERLVFSFISIEKYGRVRRNLKLQGLSTVREFTDDEITEFCTGLAELNKKWGLIVTACGELRDLSQYDIGKGQCINFGLITQEFRSDRELMEFLHPAGQQTFAGSVADTEEWRWLKDPGQRSSCGCIASKDIGEYSTCMHLCAYCYANISPADVRRRYSRFCLGAENGIFHEGITE